MQTSELLCPSDLDDTETCDRPNRHEVEDGDIWSSDDNQGDINGAPAVDTAPVDIPFAVQQFFSEDDISDEDESPATLSTCTEDRRADAAAETNATRPPSDLAVPLEHGVAGAGATGARTRRRKRARDTADSLGRDIWLPLWGMTLLEEEALPALALCPSRYILLRYGLDATRSQKVCTVD